MELLEQLERMSMDLDAALARAYPMKLQALETCIYVRPDAESGAWWVMEQDEAGRWRSEPYGSEVEAFIARQACISGRLYAYHLTQTA